ncbi:hypothetical protein TNCV_3541511 [Trichonephila clavipes]|nr:hypothetical protein TNCV_3541511 [Trichonephila clavipes]
MSVIHNRHNGVSRCATIDGACLTGGTDASEDERDRDGIRNESGFSGSKRQEKWMNAGDLTSGTTENYGEASFGQCRDVWGREMQRREKTDHTSLAQRDISMSHY